MITIVGIVIGLVVAGLALILVGANSRGPRITGAPTPEESRIVLVKSESETDKAAEEAKSAPLEQKIDRFRALREFGRMRRGK